MKPGNVYQEIILVAGPAYDHQLSKYQGWEHLLRALIASARKRISTEDGLYLWQVTNSALFFELCGDNPEHIRDDYFSIDPYAFLNAQPLN
jgi:hypothetical protein